MKVVSIGKMLETLEGLVGTRDIDAWETDFIKRNLQRYRSNGNSTSCLSEKVVLRIDELYNKHFSGLS